MKEKLYFFTAEYDKAAKQADGGGMHKEGEDIETLELGFEYALSKIAMGEIRDGKTIMFLQYAGCTCFPDSETALDFRNRSEAD